MRRSVSLSKEWSSCIRPFAETGSYSVLILRFLYNTAYKKVSEEGIETLGTLKKINFSNQHLFNTGYKYTLSYDGWPIYHKERKKLSQITLSLLCDTANQLLFIGSFWFHPPETMEICIKYLYKGQWTMT